jgi:hypothetical protein
VSQGASEVLMLLDLPKFTSFKPSGRVDGVFGSGSCKTMPLDAGHSQRDRHRITL